MPESAASPRPWSQSRPWPCSHGLLLASRPSPSLGHIYDVPGASHSPRRRHPGGYGHRAATTLSASPVLRSLASLGHSLDARLSQLRCSVASRRFVSTGSLAQLDWERLSLAPPSAATLAKPRQPSTTSLYFPPPSNTYPCPRIRSSILKYTVTSLPTLFLHGWATDFDASLSQGPTLVSRSLSRSLYSWRCRCPRAPHRLNPLKTRRGANVSF